MADFQVDLGDGRIVVRQHFDPLARLLGLPFLAGGLYTLHFVPLAVYKYVRAGQFLGLAATLPGLSFAVLLALGFASPGILLTLMGKRVVFDLGTHQVMNVLDFIFWRWTRRYPLSAFKKLSLRHEIMRSDPSSSRRTATSFYTVQLLSDGEAAVTLAIVDDPEEGAGLGREMSGRLGVPFVDETRPRTG